MKKFLTGLLILLVLLSLLGGAFFLLDKNEYYSKGGTKFTINEDLGEGLTRRIGLGYVMYTRDTGFPLNEDDHITTSWFNMISREKALEKLAVEEEEFTLPGLTEEETQVAMYYSNLIMNDFNENVEKFDTKDLETLYINLDNFIDLKTGEKIDSKVADAIINSLTELLENPDYKIENKELKDIVTRTIALATIRNEVKNGLYIKVNVNEEKNEIDLIIHKSDSKQSKTTYSYDLDILEKKEYKVFEKVK